MVLAGHGKLGATMMDALRILFLSLVFACAGQAFAQDCTETRVSKEFYELKQEWDQKSLDFLNRSDIVDRMERVYNFSNCLERRIFYAAKGDDLGWHGDEAVARNYLSLALSIGGMSTKEKSEIYLSLASLYSLDDLYDQARWAVRKSIEAEGRRTERHDREFSDIDTAERWHQDELAAKVRQTQPAPSTRSSTAPRPQNCAPQYNNCMAQLNHNLSGCLSDCQRNGYDGCNQDCREFADYDRPICESQYGHCKGNASGGGYTSSGYGSSSQPQSDRNWERGDDFKDMFDGKGCPGVNYGSTCVCQRCAASYPRNSLEYRMYQGCEARFYDGSDRGYIECAVE